MGVVRVLIVIFVVLAVLTGVGYAVYRSPVGANLRGAVVSDGGGGWAGLGGGGGEGAGEAVQTQAAAVGDIVRTVSAPGSIEPRTRVQISSQVSARVLALPFREGDTVRKGDVVVRLDPQDLVAVLDSAEAGMKGQQARLGGAEAMLINARLEYERLRSLFETGDVTRAEMEGSEASYLQAQSDKQALEHGIEQAQAQIDQAKKDLENTTINSPMDGIITTLNAEVGETVIVGTTNNAGSVILEIADLSSMLLKAAVDEANIAPVRVGQEARVFINAYPEREYRGTVRRIGLKRQVAQDGTGTFEVEIELELDEGETLYSGLTASTDIAVEHFYDTLRVPSQAVVDRRVDDLPPGVRENNPLVDADKTFTRVVYQIVGGKAVVTPVRAGASDLTGTQVLGGLSAGDVVVTGPFRVLVNLKHDQALHAETPPGGADAVGAGGGEAGEDQGGGEDAAGGSDGGEPSASPATADGG